MHPLPRSAARRPSAGRAAILALSLLTLLILVASAGSFVLFLRALRTQERTLQGHLETSAALVAENFSDYGLQVLELVYDPVTRDSNFEVLDVASALPQAQELRRSLESSADHLPNFELTILTPSGFPLLAPEDYYFVPVTEGGRYEQDGSLIAGAAEGYVQSSAQDPFDESKRVYLPLRARDEGPVVGILRLEAGRTYGRLVRRQIQRLIAVTILFVLLLIFLWVVLARLIRRTAESEKAANLNDRLRALGTTTAGVAHELRNPLGIMLLSVEELQTVASEVTSSRTRTALQQGLSDVLEEIRRLQALTAQFLDLHQTAARTEVFDFRRAIDQTLHLFRKGLPPGVDVRWQPPEHSMPVRIAEARVRQILLNLLQNALQAMPERKGAITVTLREARGQAVLEVADTGQGMDASVLAQVFDPFFTTRADGTGLGLPISRSLVQAAQGEITVESEPGKGTTVRVRLPLIRKREDQSRTTGADSD